MTEPQELDRIRRRWSHHHRRLGLPDPFGRTDVSPGGLGGRVDDLSTRIVILPVDPMATLLEFDDEFWAWWGADRPAPFGTRLMWNTNVPTVDAAARVRTLGDRWHTFLAVHRHGGVEVGTADTYGRDEEHRCFRLIRTVGLLWIAFDRQAEVHRQVNVGGPWEVTLAIHRTDGAHLGDLGAGWAEPFSGVWDLRPCREPNVLMREELEAWPEEPDDVKELSFRFGGRIEDAWGMRQRRFLDHRGELEGQFDAGRWEL